MTLSDTCPEHEQEIIPKTDRLAGLYWLAGIALIVLTTWVRYWFVSTGQLGLSPDEAQYWDWSRTLQWSYYSKGPLIACINALSTKFFGPTELGVRMGAIAGSALLQVAVLGWIGLGWGRIRTAFWTLAVLNTTILFMAGGLLMTTDNPLLLCWVLAMICLSQAVQRGHSLAFWMLAVLLALGVMAKYTMLAFIPLALLTGLCLGRDLPERFWPRLVKALGLGGLAGLAPILVWNVTNDWVGIKHVLYRGGLAGDRAKVFFQMTSFPEYMGSQLGVLTPWWFVFMLLGAWLVLRQLFAGRQRWETAAFPWLSRQNAMLLTVFFWPLWLFFLFWSLHTKVEANWSATAYPAGIVLAALALERLLQCAGRPRRILLWPVLGVLVFLALHAQALIPFDSPKNPVHRLLGWADLGQRIESIRTDELSGSDSSFVFSDTYGLTAALSFYVPGQHRAYCVAGARKMNQYDFWPGPGQHFQDAVFVRRGEVETVPDLVRELFASVSEPSIFVSRQGHRTGQTFTLFLCRGYKGEWPQQVKGTF